MNKTIFVVEDEPDLLDLMRELLMMEGYTVLTANSSTEASTVWNNNSSTIDLLLTDLTLPGGVNGIALAAKLRGEKPLLKIIYSSGHSADVIATQFTLLPDATFLQKPFHPASLSETIQKALLA